MMYYNPTDHRSQHEGYMNPDLRRDAAVAMAAELTRMLGEEGLHQIRFITVDLSSTAMALAVAEELGLSGDYIWQGSKYHILYMDQRWCRWVKEDHDYIVVLVDDYLSSGTALMSANRQAHGVDVAMFISSSDEARTPTQLQRVFISRWWVYTREWEGNA